MADLFSNTELEDLSFIQQWELGSLNQKFPSQSIWECLDETISPEGYTSGSALSSPQSSASVEGPEKIAVTNKSWNSPSTTPSILSFGNPSSPLDLQADGCFMPMEAVSMDENGLKRAKVARSRPVAVNQEHVIAERKRREKITEKLIALSAIIPGLKKRDKASILTDTISYMKQMEEKVKTLEGQAVKEKAPEPAVAVKKCRLSADSDESCDNDGLRLDRSCIDIDVRISEMSVLIRIHCKERKGVLVKALTEIENHHLTVINTIALPFSDRFLDITVNAQVEEGFSMTVNDLLNKLKTAFGEFM